MFSWFFDTLFFLHTLDVPYYVYGWYIYTPFTAKCLLTSKLLPSNIAGVHKFMMMIVVVGASKPDHIA